MLKAHLTRDDAEQYILGALAPEKAAALEAHTVECEPCARLLQEEALLEEQAHEVAATFAPREHRVLRPATWGGRRVAAGAMSALLAAAASLALVVHRGGTPPPTSLPPSAHASAGPVVEFDEGAEVPQVVMVACPDLATEAECTQSAVARGLLVLSPGGVAEVPRYEGHSGFPAGALPSGPASL
ncbi:hypothetical protein DRW03_11960 [Corallococcus sp. H22C18031201]|nr:hypothetical protein DRW03_11960 [Corallococcus sp. H22C18031201]